MRCPWTLGASPRRSTCGPSTPNPTPRACPSPRTASRSSLPMRKRRTGVRGSSPPPPQEWVPRAGPADVAMLRARLEGAGSGLGDMPTRRPAFHRSRQRLSVYRGAPSSGGASRLGGVRPKLATTFRDLNVGFAAVAPTNA